MMIFKNEKSIQRLGLLLVWIVLSLWSYDINGFHVSVSRSFSKKSQRTSSSRYDIIPSISFSIRCSKTLKINSISSSSYSISSSSDCISSSLKSSSIPSTNHNLSPSRSCTSSLHRSYSTSNSRMRLYMAGGQTPMVPFYPNGNQNPNEYMWMDIYNVLGRQKRTLFVGRFLDDESCNQLIASLIWLQGQSDKEPITMYFNVPGSMMKPALAVYDVMRRLNCPIHTYNMGLTSGMGAILCAAGSKGHRYCFPNARFLMSRVGLEDAIEGQASDISLAVAEVQKDNIKVLKDLSIITSQSYEKISQDFRRDFYLTAPEAVSYGIVDKVLMPASPVKMKVYRGTDDKVINFGHFSEIRKVKAHHEDESIVTIPGKRISL